MAPVTYNGAVGGSTGAAVGGNLSFFNDRYHQPLMDLLPNGPVWPRESDTWLSKLMKAASYIYARIERRGKDLLRESDPRTTYELLAEWEEALGITPSGTLAQRRNVIVTQLRGLGNPSTEHFIQIAESLGFSDIEVQTYSPLVAGDPSGFDVHDVAWRFRADLVAHVRDAVAEAELVRQAARLKPLHTYVGRIDPYRKLQDSATFPTGGTGFNKTVLDLTFVADAKMPGSLIAVGQVQAPDPIRGAVWASRDGRVWSRLTIAGISAYTGQLLAVRGNSFGDVLAVGTAGQTVVRIGGDTLVINTPVASGSPDLRCVAFGGPSNDRFLTAGAGGTIFTLDRPALNTFVARTPAGSFAGQFRGACWSSKFGRFYLVGDSGEVQSSLDGVTWTRQTVGAVNLFRCWATSDAVILSSYNGSGVNETGKWISTDGTTFTAWSGCPIDELAALAEDYKGTLLVGGALNASTPAWLYTSPDKGVTWTARTRQAGSMLNDASRFAIGNADLPIIVGLSANQSFYSYRNALENLI